MSGIKLDGIEEADAWSSSIMLPVGWHKVTIEEASLTKSPQQGVPQVEIRFVGDAGDIRDWLTVTREAMGRVKSFLLACQLPFANGQDFPLEKLSDRVLEIYVGERDRPDGQGGTKKVREVKAFRAASDVADATKSDDDIPF